MRRDWFCSPAAVAVAAAFLSGSAPLSVSAAPLLLAASVASGDGGGKVVAQASALPPPMAGEPAAAPTSDEGASTAAIAADAPATGEVAPPVSPDPEASPLAPPPGMGPRMANVLPGDDTLPTMQELRNNPYLVQNADENGLFTGDLSGAYVPPPAPPTQTQRLQAESQEMQSILGAEVYNRRVNITTPPDTEVAEVVRLLAERAGLNFVYAEGVIRGRVTLNLRDVPLGAALQSLLATQGLVIIREGENVMRITTRQEGGAQTVETRTIYIKLNWVPAPSLVTAISSVLQQGKVTAQAEANTLIVTDVPGNIQLVRDLVAQLDVPDKQVMIESRMVEFLLSYGRTQGSRTTIESPEPSALTFANQTVARPYTVLDPTAEEPTVIQTPEDFPLPVDQFISTLIGSSANPTVTFGGVISIFGKEFNVATALDALENRRLVNVLANPRVITLNNQEAFIDIKREIPYLEAQQGVATDVIQSTVKFKDAGVSIRVLPNITNSGFVRMRLEPEQRIFSGTFTNPAGGTIPIIDRRNAITNVIVKDEDTVVIGGLREIDSGDSRSQVPWIGQAPIIGWFFKNNSRNHLKNELMIFVTPHVVKAPVLAPAETYKYSRIDNHWDLPDFFFDETVEQRENRHRGEIDFDANSYYPMPLRLPPAAPAAPAAPGVPVEGDAAFALPEEGGK